MELLSQVLITSTTSMTPASAEEMAAYQSLLYRSFYEPGCCDRLLHYARPGEGASTAIDTLPAEPASGRPHKLWAV